MQADDSRTPLPALAEVMPQQGAMILLDSVIVHDPVEGTRCIWTGPLMPNSAKTCAPEIASPDPSTTFPESVLIPIADEQSIRAKATMRIKILLV